MERIDPKFSRDLPHLTLYLDDLAILSAIMKKHGRVALIQIGNIRTEDPLELASLDEKYVYKIDISGDSMRHEQFLGVTLEINGISSRLSSNTNHPDDWALASEIEFHLLKKKQRFGGITHSLGLGAVVSVSSICVIMVLLMMWTRPAGTPPVYLITPTTAFALLLLSLLGLFFSYWLSCNVFSRHSKVVLRQKRECPSFWQRNSEKFATAFITAIVVAPVSILTTLIITSIKQPQDNPTPTTNNLPISTQASTQNNRP